LGLALTFPPAAHYASTYSASRSAVSSPGNLLGNLLCSVANLLNNPQGLANLLNQILGALRL